MITWDESGGRWTEVPPRKRRKPSRAVRFADIKVGDQLKRPEAAYLIAGDRTLVRYYVVTDLWFDPVAGQDDPIAGQMVAIRRIDPRTGEPIQRKQPHTRRGLAMQGFHYAGIDYMAMAAARRSAMQEGSVVGIGLAHMIRARPKYPVETYKRSTFDSALESKTLDVSQTALQIDYSRLEHCSQMAAPRLDVQANIAREKAERDAQRVVEKRLRRGRDIIYGARKIVESIPLDLATIEELLLNEVAEVREERREREMIRKLKAGV